MKKVHSVIHFPKDVARFCHYLNYSCEAPEKSHKIWVGQQEEKTNQGPESQKSMMLHSLRKEKSSLLCEAMRGKLWSTVVIIIFTWITYFIYFTYRVSTIVILDMSMMMLWSLDEKKKTDRKCGGATLSYVQIVGTTRLWINYEITPNNQVCTLYLLLFFGLVYVLYLVYILNAVSACHNKMSTYRLNSLELQKPHWQRQRSGMQSVPTVVFGDI